MITLEHPVIAGTAALLGIHPGLVVMILTWIAIAGYMVVFWLLLRAKDIMQQEWEDYGRWYDWIIYAVLWLVVTVLNTIHLIITLGAIYHFIKKWNNK